MARRTTTTKNSVVLEEGQVRAAIPKVQRRLDELMALDVYKLDNVEGPHTLDGLTQKTNATIRDIYGADSVEYGEFSIVDLMPRFVVFGPGSDNSLRGNLEWAHKNVLSARTTLKSLLEILHEQLTPPGDENSASKALRAYSGLELHSEISRAASKLYKDGHYANAVEAAVKSLNGLVRLRSGLEQDGVTLMERAFNPSNPVIKFNALQDQSDKDEQKGFMQMFCGAVSGLRNPRAHKFLRDDPERALEFIAFVSLLAKLLDEATA